MLRTKITIKQVITVYLNLFIFEVSFQRPNIIRGSCGALRQGEVEESRGSQLAVMTCPEESRRISPVELSLGADWFGN
jgi:hypothetical protein